MSRPQSKRDLAEAGRRKLEAFRAQKAAAKAFKDAPAPQLASTLQEHHGIANSPASPANTSGSDVLSRAPSALPLSTHAGPISYGGSDVEAPDNRKLLTRQSISPGEATGQSSPTYPVSSAPEPLVHIPFTGRDSTDSSSTQQQTPQSAGAAAVPATSNPNPVVPIKYQSRLPPPPPVFKPPVRSQVGSVQSDIAGNSSSVQPSSPLPFRPGMLLGATKSVSSSLSQAPVRSPVQIFNPATAASSSKRFQQQAASPSSSAITATAAATASTTASTATAAPPTAATTTGRPTSSYRHAWSFFGTAQSNKEPTAPATAAAAGDESAEARAEATRQSAAAAAAGDESTDESAEAVEVAARQSAAEEEAFQLTLVNELRMLPEVSTGRDVDNTGRSGDSGHMLHVSQSGDIGLPFSEQVDGNPPGSRSKNAVLPTFPESPDSPLVFPWSQGPRSTGTASAYASLSDSYLSRPPSQTPSQAPSQAPSPSKQSQLATPAAATPAQHAQHESIRPPSAKHAQQEPSGATSSADQAQSTASSLSPTFKRPLDPTSGTSRGSISSPAYHSDSPVGQVRTSPGPPLPTGRAFQALPNGQVGSPSGPPLPTGHAFQAHSSGPLSNGPVSVAPWRKQPPTASPTARPQPPQLGSPATTAGPRPPQPSSTAAASALWPSNMPPTGSGMLLPTEAPYHLSAERQQPTHPNPLASEALNDHMTMKPPQQAQHDPSMILPWRNQRPPFMGGMPQLNGGRAYDDAASSASGDSSFPPASAEAGASADPSADVVSQGLDRRNGSMPTLHKGVGSHTSLADSLANGTLPVKSSKFTALQHHIDDLTKEKFELVRGLQEQQKMAASLAEENLLVTDDFNYQAEALQQTRRELRQLEEEVREQLVSMEQLTAERDACKSGAHEASDRSKSLAAEVVALEEKVLQTRSREIRLQKDTASLQEGLQEAEKQLQASRREGANLQSTIDMLQEEKGCLLAKLRQAAGRPHDAAAALGQHQPAPPTHAAPQHAQPTASATLQQMAAMRQPAAADEAETASSTGSEGQANRQTSGAGMSTSARLVEHVLDRHQNQPDQFGAIATPDAMPHALASWLPASFPAAASVTGDEGVVAEQQQLLQSIHAMIGNLEAEKRSCLGMLDSSQAELQDLRYANSKLQRKLESQTQRLELAIQQQAHASPHAFSPSSYATQHTHQSVPQLQQSGPVDGQVHPQLGPHSLAEPSSLQQQLQQWQQPSTHGESGLQLQSRGQQQQQLGSNLYSAGYARSAPPTPQQGEAQKPFRVPAEGPPSGVLGWLGNIIAPRPQPRQQELMI